MGRITKTAVKRGMKSSHKNKGSVTHEGFHSKIVVQNARKYLDNERTSQFLRHLATAFKEMATKSEIEVQIALVADNYFMISSNKTETATEIYNNLVTKYADKTVEDQLKTLAKTVYDNRTTGKNKDSTARDTYRLERHSDKLSKELIGTRTKPQAVDKLKKKGADICIELDVETDCKQAVVDFCSGKNGKYVAIVKGRDTAHAEQKILLALCKAIPDLDIKTSVVVAGTFRPCRGCFESLCIVKQYYLSNLQFGDRPGHYWYTTNDEHLQIFHILMNKGKIKEFDLKDFNKNFIALVRQNMDTHHSFIRNKSSVTVEMAGNDSDSDSDED